MKTLNIGLVGYGFMGRTHSNAFLQAPRYFDLPYKPVLKAVSARNEERVKKFAANWGYESYETDWRAGDTMVYASQEAWHVATSKFVNGEESRSLWQWMGGLRSTPTRWRWRSSRRRRTG